MNSSCQSDDPQQGGELKGLRAKGLRAQGRDAIEQIAVVLREAGVAVVLLRLSIGLTELSRQVTRRDLDEDWLERMAWTRVGLAMVKNRLGEHGGGSRQDDYRDACEEMKQQMESIDKDWETDGRQGGGNDEGQDEQEGSGSGSKMAAEVARAE